MISQSPTDVQPVLDAVAEAAVRFCGATDAAIGLRDGDAFRLVAQNGPLAMELGRRESLNRGSSMGRSILEGQTCHLPDIAALDPVEWAAAHRLSAEFGQRAALAAPMLRDGVAIGSIALRKLVAGPFAPHQIELLETFAAQAVIAIENVRLFRELQQRTDSLTESLEYQTATSEVLEVISRSTAELQPVLDIMVSAAVRLCAAVQGTIAIRQGDVFRHVATIGVGPVFDRALRERPLRPGRGTITERVLLEKQVVHVPDVTAEPGYALRDASWTDRIHTALGVPLLREGEPLGVFVLSRDRIEPFTERQISLVKTFADQAVIAMENARLLGELQSSLEQQTATAEILRVINASPGDLTPVFRMILEKAHSTCGADMGSLFVWEDGRIRAVVTMGYPAEIDALLRQSQPLPGWTAPLLAGARFHHRVFEQDRAKEEPSHPFGAAFLAGSGIRTNLIIPLRKDAAILGFISANRRDVRAYSDTEIALLENFADQAVIAMENARLLGELRSSLAQQTAMAEVLGLINSSTGDITPVFDAMVAKAMTLCDAPFGTMFSWDGEFMRVVSSTYALQGQPNPFAEPMRIDPAMELARVLRTGETGHTVDLTQSEAYRRRVPLTVHIVEQAGARTMIMVPLVGERGTVGLFTLFRTEVRPFSDQQVALVEAFAQQAVVAMENARLLGELTRREQELSVTFDHMGEGVVMFDADARLASWNKHFQELLDVPDSFLAGRPGLEDYVRLLVERGELGDGDVERQVAAYRKRVNQPWSNERVRPDGRVIEVRNNPVPGGGSVLIYSDITERKKAEAEIRAARDTAESALERQTATADILKVIASSPTDVQPVLDAVVAAAQRFCGAADVSIALRDGSEMYYATHVGPFPATVERAPLDPTRSSGRAILDGKTVHLHDIRQLDSIEFASARRLSAEVGFQASLAAPMMREDLAIGCILLRKPDPEAFTPQQIELLETFAAQAVIAIENVRLFSELRESLEQQTATSDILRIISQSPTDVSPVLAAVARAALKFCGALDALVTLRDGDTWSIAAHEGPLGALLGARPLTRGTAPGRAMLDGKVVHYRDLESAEGEDFPEARVFGRQEGFRATLAAPLLRDDVAIGAIALRRAEPATFTANQIELLKSFAAQAVIAIENVRLFNDLREALEQQTATAEILRVISQSPTDVGPVLVAVAKAALKFCGAGDAQVVLRSNDTWFVAAHEGPITAVPGQQRLNRLTPPGMAMLDGKVVQVADLQSSEGDEFPEARQLGATLGFRSALVAPLLRDDGSIGAIALRRAEPGDFTLNQIELLETFAAQAVIAIENVRLFTELRDSLERLKAAQANLVQSEKMASLGQLTAGIAHEIKNPLNFVNNFASLSGELLEELKETVEALLAAPDDDKRADLQDTMTLLTGNLAKIVEHGRRADGIVKSMLAHSRGGTGDWQTCNLNSLVEEALNLAFHGARAKDKDFNVTLERDFEAAAKPIDLVPQDVTRVFLNLIGNGFYAVRKRQRDGADRAYRPVLKVATRDLGDAVEVRVRDNGTGIPRDVRDKLFQPFFTTKPTGEGTGLGLSISYDVVTQQHGGSIEVESEPGLYTEFTVRLPRARRAAAPAGDD